MDDRRRRTPISSNSDEIHTSSDLEEDFDSPELDDEDGASTVHRTPAAAPQPAPGKWLEDARTMWWDSDKEAADREASSAAPWPEEARRRGGIGRDRSIPERDRSAAGRDRSIAGRDRSSAAHQPRPSRSIRTRSPMGGRGRESLVPYDGPDADSGDERPAQQLLIEAPIRIKVTPVARISPDPQLCLMTKPHSAAAEQYRVLALKLREDRAARVVAVAGVNRETDATLAAANLALAFAESNRTRVALVDVDLHGSKLAKLFELNEGCGLGEQIRQHRREANQLWITVSLTSNLQLLPAGPTERNPAALLSSEVVEDLMHELRRYYDFIVLAAPPIMESADVNILQEYVDGILLVVHAGVTKRPAVSASIARLGENRFLGALLLGVTLRREPSR